MSRSKKWRLKWPFFPGKNGRRQYNKLCKVCVYPCNQSLRAVVVSFPQYFPVVPKSVGIRVQNGQRNRLWQLFRVGAV